MSGFADSLAAMGERKAIKAAISQLDNMFDGAASRSFEAGVVHDWATEPYIHCGYSYPRVGGEGAFEELSKPLPNGRVMFAGEAYTDGANMTVHSALDAGARAAAEAASYLGDLAAQKSGQAARAKL